jgi:hypothetical protein
MTTFKLSRQSVGVTITKFFVYNAAGDIIGSINVPNEDAADLEKHWLGSATQPQVSTLLASSRRKENALVAAMQKRTGSPALAPARKHENPMVDAMLRVAPKNRLSPAAILRG